MTGVAAAERDGNGVAYPRGGGTRLAGVVVRGRWGGIRSGVGGASGADREGERPKEVGPVERQLPYETETFS